MSAVCSQKEDRHVPLPGTVFICQHHLSVSSLNPPVVFLSTEKRDKPRIRERMNEGYR
jgi:hypothetical protein